ncbi:AAA family ATPase [Thermomonospora amylolytica]|uniref:AAA family ATPase n=1 Tax=Thermomonospora amylolytica TaxID=1411117 RepID=UPI000E6C1D84|nr:AAA family ATPase [Thermomonospora amylolytica]
MIPLPQGVPPIPERDDVPLLAAEPVAESAGPGLRFPGRSLVLVAGLPGAGKSTLLARLYGMRGDESEPVRAGRVHVIDSRQARNWWARRLRPLPPRAQIPFIYTTHVLRIVRALTAGHPVVAHTRGTWAHLLYGLAWLARRHDTSLHLVLIDVPPEIARAGQVARGRVLTTVAFARHCRRWDRLVARARAGAVPPADTVTVLDRAAADRLPGIDFGPQG